jgi:acetyltransferase-like isoleucine patch superfamily enzyme
MRDVALGDFTYIANGARIVHATIGKFCSVGPNCKIGLGLHPTRGFVSTHPAFFSNQLQAGITFVNTSLFEEYRLIEIGSDVWIGEGAMVMDGVKIGDGAIIGAGAIVTKNVPAYAVAVGIPAKVVRFRFSPGDINLLLSAQWWNKDIEWLRKNAPDFASIERLKSKLS